MIDYKEELIKIKDILYDRDGYTKAKDLGKLIDSTYYYICNILKVVDKKPNDVLVSSIDTSTEAYYDRR
jgi:hypothetical protein